MAWPAMVLIFRPAKPCLMSSGSFQRYSSDWEKLFAREISDNINVPFLVGRVEEGSPFDAESGCSHSRCCLGLRNRVLLNLRM